jgi:hypothetical protein
MTQPAVKTAEPSALAPEEIADFQSFVLAGGEVEPDGLRDRVLGASFISLLRENACLLGVGGLKRPSAGYRQRVATNSKVKLAEEHYPFELGWVFILPSARNRKLSLPLCEPLVAAANGRGIFATSRVSNLGMHATLRKLGFNRVGSDWRSQRADENLALFQRPSDA